MPVTLTPPGSGSSNSWPQFRVYSTATEGLSSQQKSKAPVLVSSASKPQAAGGSISGNTAYGLAQLLSRVAQIKPELGVQLAGALPGGVSTASAILRFVIAAKNNELANALPQQLWSQAKNTLPQTLQERWTALERQWLSQNPWHVKDTANQAWRLIDIPWWQREQADVMRLFYRINKEAPKKKTKMPVSDIKLFVVELIYSGLGPIQVEGLVDEANGRMKLTVRSEKALPDDLQNMLRQTCYDAMGREGWHAVVAFHVLAGYCPPVAGVSGETDWLV